MFIGDNWIDPEDIFMLGVIAVCVVWAIVLAKAGKFRCD